MYRGMSADDVPHQSGSDRELSVQRGRLSDPLPICEVLTAAGDQRGLQEVSVCLLVSLRHWLSLSGPRHGLLLLPGHQVHNDDIS